MFMPPMVGTPQYHGDLKRFTANKVALNNSKTNIGFKSSQEAQSTVAPDSSDITSEGCGKSKGCISEPSGCSNRFDCYILVTFAESKDGESVHFEVLGNPNQTLGYIAVGLSEDQLMGNDDVYACVAGQKGLVRMNNTGPSVNGEKHGSSPIPLLNGTTSNFNLSNVDGIIQCTYTRAKKDSDKSYADLDKEYYILVARGIQSKGVPQFHGDLKVASNQKVAVTNPKTHIGFTGGSGTKAPPPTSITTEGCGDSKGCIREPENCPVSNCSMFVSFAETTDKKSVVFEMAGRKSGDGDWYIALGFSDIKKMGPAEAYSCATNKNEAIRMYNAGTGKNSVINLVNGTVSDFSQSVVDDMIECSFTRVKQNSAEKFTDLNSTFYFIYARGPVKDGEPIYHGLKTRSITPKKLAVNESSTNIGSKQSLTYYKVHASLMIIGWLLCAGPGALIARYTKPFWPNSKLLGEKVWFTLHRSLMVTNVLCFCTAFAVIFVQVGGYVDTPSKRVNAHAVLGIIAVTLGLTNPVLALFRPPPESPKRKIFYWFHYSFGNLAIIASSTNIYLGIGMAPLNLPKHTTLAMIIYTVVTVLIIIVALEVITLKANLRKGYSSNKNDKKALVEKMDKDTTKVTKKKLAGFMTFYLVHTVFMAVYLVYFIVIQEDSD